MHATDGTSGTGTADSGNLHAALHAIRYGIVLLDAGYHAVFINNAFRRMWRLPDDLAESAPPVGVLFEHGWSQGFYRVQEGEHDSYIATRSEEHTSELQSLMRTSYAVFCLKHKNKHQPLLLTTFTIFVQTKQQITLLLV